MYFKIDFYVVLLLDKMALKFIEDNCHRLHFDGNVAIDTLTNPPKMYQFDLDTDEYQEIGKSLKYLFKAPNNLTLNHMDHHICWLFLGRFNEGEWVRESTQDQKKHIEVLNNKNEVIRFFEIEKCFALRNDHQNQVFYALVNHNLDTQILIKYDYNFKELDRRMVSCSAGTQFECVSKDRVLICDMGCYPREFKYV